MLSVEDVAVDYDGSAALDGVDLVVGDGEVVALLGPSGCGKTTLLRAIAGLEPARRGRIVLDGRDLVSVPTHQRGIGLMFQDYALFPHRDVARNVAFGLEMRGVPTADRMARVVEVLDLVGLRGFESRAVATLSGGERQRVALARALAPSPGLLMLDEPLGALDRTLRERLVLELSEVFARLAIGVVYVTHDHTEALALADRVVVMEAGQIVQEGPPEQLWSEPANPFVARFLGLTNLFDLDGDRARPPRWLDGRGTGTTNDQGSGRADRGTVLVRPEAVAIGSPSEPGATAACVEAVAFRGDHTQVWVRMPDGARLEGRIVGRGRPAVGDEVGVRIDPSGIHRL
jgi:thiamine transport system ATP-binding protein